MGKLDASKLRLLIRASIALGVAFGLGWTGEQVAAVTLVAELTIAVVKDLWRSQFQEEPE